MAKSEERTAKSERRRANGEERTAKSEQRLPNHQHFANVVTPKEKLHGRIIAEEILNVPVVEDALQFVGAGGLQFQRVFRGNVVAVKRSLGTGVLGVEERQHNAAGLHGHLDALD